MCPFLSIRTLGGDSSCHRHHIAAMGLGRHICLSASQAGVCSLQFIISRQRPAQLKSIPETVAETFNQHTVCQEVYMDTLPFSTRTLKCLFTCLLPDLCRHRPCSLPALVQSQRPADSCKYLLKWNVPHDLFMVTLKKNVYLHGSPGTICTYTANPTEPRTEMCVHTSTGNHRGVCAHTFTGTHGHKCVNTSGRAQKSPKKCFCVPTD